MNPIIYQFPTFIPCEVNLIWWTAQCIVSSTYRCIPCCEHGLVQLKKLTQTGFIYWVELGCTKQKLLLGCILIPYKVLLHHWWEMWNNLRSWSSSLSFVVFKFSATRSRNQFFVLNGRLHLMWWDVICLSYPR